MDNIMFKIQEFFKKISDYIESNETLSNIDLSFFLKYLDKLTFKVMYLYRLYKKDVYIARLNNYFGYSVDITKEEEKRISFLKADIRKFRLSLIGSLLISPCLFLLTDVDNFRWFVVLLTLITITTLVVMIRNRKEEIKEIDKSTILEEVYLKYLFTDLIKIFSLKESFEIVIKFKEMVDYLDKKIGNFDKEDLVLDYVDDKLVIKMRVD